MSLEDDLLAEIRKWTRRLDEALTKASSSGEAGGRLLENVRAYRRDSEHFLGRGDFIRSYECLIWAWAILETGRELGFLR